MLMSGGASGAPRLLSIKFIYKKSYKNLVERKIKSCGHMIHLEEPKKLAEIFEKFIGNAI